MWRRRKLGIIINRSITTSNTFSYSSTSSSSSSEIPTLYSFLQPTIFALRRPIQPPPPPPEPPETCDSSIVESSLQSALHASRTDDAWRSFKTLASHSLLPAADLSNSLISHLSSLRDRHNLKRAFASAVFLLERSPRSLSFDTARSLFAALASAGSLAPALALTRSMLRAGVSPPFSLWGPPLIEIANTPEGFAAFLRVFEESCKLAKDGKVGFMAPPDMEMCNKVLHRCCWVVCSVADAEKVIQIMSSLGLSPDAQSLGMLAYLYASKGLRNRIEDLNGLMCALGFKEKKKRSFFHNMVSGYVRAKDFVYVSDVVLRALREEDDDHGNVLEEEGYVEVLKGFVDNGRIKDLATLIIESQEIESRRPADAGVDRSVGYGIVRACVGLGWLDKAHNLLDEMNARGAPVGLGVYTSIMRAYCKERRTAEAAQLVTEIAASGLRLDAGSYEALIDASMSNQDFQSAFSLFKDMKEAMLLDLKPNFLAVMTGLMESHRPELMAAFMDSVVDDPRVEVATHDWNSIIHSFCKAGRMEDARRTYRRMLFLQFLPNNQTFLSLINGYVAVEKYFSVLILWTEVRRKGFAVEHEAMDAFLYARVKGGFFDAAMQVVEKAQEMKIFIDKWRHKQAFMDGKILVCNCYI